jgi:GH24 family phage-related lysozyme (muramidase)
MKTSKHGYELIKRFEGLRLSAYTCAAGKWTIGYGHTGTVGGKRVRKGMKITKGTAEKLLVADAKRFEKAVNDLGRRWTQNQFDALVSFAFNCGEKNLHTLCKNRTAAEISDAILLYRKAGGKVNQGLVDRRRAERKLFLR